MNKSILTLISGFLLISSGVLYAAQAPVAGTSVLKLEDNPVRSARVSIAVIDTQVAALDQQILDTKNQAALLKALPSNGVQSQQMEMLATAYEIQKNDLLLERSGLQAVVRAE